MTGAIKALNRGFGFIRAENRLDYFFHYSALATGLAMDALRLGDAVEFEVETSERGPRACNVRFAEAPAGE